MTIEEQVYQMGEDAKRYAAEGNLDDRGLVLVLDAYQRLLDYYDQLLDSEIVIEPWVSPDEVADSIMRLL
ncbi:MAG TPA: hypothetical protein VIY48_01615 [Candidatus Paceibacterota bacterium]